MRPHSQLRLSQISQDHQLPQARPRQLPGRKALSPVDSALENRLLSTKILGLFQEPGPPLVVMRIFRCGPIRYRRMRDLCLEQAQSQRKKHSPIGRAPIQAVKSVLHLEMGRRLWPHHTLQQQHEPLHIRPSLNKLIRVLRPVGVIPQQMARLSTLLVLDPTIATYHQIWHNHLIHLPRMHHRQQSVKSLWSFLRQQPQSPRSQSTFPCARCLLELQEFRAGIRFPDCRTLRFVQVVLGCLENRACAITWYRVDGSHPPRK